MTLASLGYRDGVAQNSLASEDSHGRPSHAQEYSDLDYMPKSILQGWPANFHLKRPLGQQNQGSGMTT